MANIIYVTQEWLEKLQAELKKLKEITRIEIAEKLKEAISFWDLSENSEYEDARNEQASIEKRISDIEEQLLNIQIIKEDDNKNLWDKISIWSIVEIQDLETNEKEKYKIVGSTETDILDKEVPKISNESPVWKTLLWKKKWDNVSVKTISWVFKYKIIGIK